MPGQPHDFNMSNMPGSTLANTPQPHDFNMSNMPGSTLANSPPLEFATPVQQSLGEGAVADGAGSGVLQFPQNLKQGDMQNWIEFQIIETSGVTAANLGAGDLADGAAAGMTSGTDILGGTNPGAGDVEGIEEGGAIGGGPEQQGISGMFTGNAGGTPGGSIALFIPAQVSTAYSFDYAMQDFSFVQTIAGGIRSIYNVLTQDNVSEDSLSPLIEGVQRIGLNSLFGAIDAVGETVGMDPNSQQAFNSATRTVTNPHMELVFNSVNPRSFSFQFLLKPRSSAESDAIQEIIKKFKVAAHPKLSDGGKYYEFPHEFDIKYHSGQGENQYINKIARSACTSINVSYGDGQGGFKTFDSGAPVAVALSLTFQELQLLTREKMEEGF